MVGANNYSQISTVKINKSFFAASFLSMACLGQREKEGEERRGEWGGVEGKQSTGEDSWNVLIFRL